MNRPSLLFLTDLNNGAEQEDILIADFLRRDFEVLVRHPSDSESLEKSVEAIIIRNVWNDTTYGKPEPWYARWRVHPDLPIHDDLYMREGEYKDYLLKLYADGFPVIPTIDTVRAIDELPESETYFIKPKDGFDAIDTHVLSREELLAMNPEHHLIQPFVDFEYEISFYYLDKKLQYVLHAPDKTERWRLEPFKPAEDDIRFAERFVRWNRQRRGIERIDACRLKDGSLQLMEITDQGGVYLSIPTLPEEMRLLFLGNLSDSLQALVAFRTGTQAG
ncbi:MAG: hypothetical protein V4480_03410 [Patescibacteria group bacterium]